MGVDRARDTLSSSPSLFSFFLLDLRNSISREIGSALLKEESSWTLPDLHKSGVLIVPHFDIELRAEALPRGLTRCLDLVREAFLLSDLPDLLIGQGIGRRQDQGMNRRTCR